MRWFGLGNVIKVLADAAGFTVRHFLFCGLLALLLEVLDHSYWQYKLDSMLSFHPHSASW